ncbi:unnamed protein product [Dovyalis caffra]|uniref:Nuclear transcription factor Y subunit n=1 Tax=Dovyalis caffra TaxID=77055 RepID=A0AAV1SNG6_9ROSI|nr:unnamed protein product [Dovyalis caffra]
MEHGLDSEGRLRIKPKEQGRVRELCRYADVTAKQNSTGERGFKEWIGGYVLFAVLCVHVEFEIMVIKCFPSVDSCSVSQDHFFPKVSMNLLKKNFDEPHFAVSCPSWWNSNEQQFSPSVSKSISFKVDPPSQPYHEAKQLGLHLPDQESSSTLSIGQSRNEMSAVGGTNSQDQCISTESDESCGKGLEGKMKPVLLLSTPDSVSNHSQADCSYSMVHTPYPCADPYFGGLFNPYGPHAFIQPQLGSHMVGMTAGRVPLPLDLADDGPIYVNAKQYHGILRRRQSRAKLEAQNKLVKNRKPYLHESRHVHALNRVRGSGGRFLSTKKPQQSDPTPTPTPSQCNVTDTSYLHRKNDASELESCQSGTDQSGASNASCSDITSVSNSDVIFRLPDRRFSGIDAHLGVGMQINGGLMCSGTQHHASVVR